MEKEKEKVRTYQEQFDSAMRCQNKTEAKRWLDEEILYYELKYEKTSEEALNIIRSNLGYMAGYYNDSTAQKVYDLFEAVHPIFGTADYHEKVTPEQAFKMGQEWGAKGK